jgi:hypothetical protein
MPNDLLRHSGHSATPLTSLSSLLPLHSMFLWLSLQRCSHLHRHLPQTCCLYCFLTSSALSSLPLACASLASSLEERYPRVIWVCPVWHIHPACLIVPNNAYRLVERVGVLVYPQQIVVCLLHAMVLAGLISQLKWHDSLKACRRSKQQHKLVTRSYSHSNRLMAQRSKYVYTPRSMGNSYTEYPPPR